MPPLPSPRTPFTRFGFLGAVLALSALAGQAVLASEADDILQALVHKGVLSEKEAAAIQDGARKEEKQSSANKIKLSDSLTELRLYGDVRLRYQYDNTDFQIDPASPVGRSSRSPGGNQRDRFRLRLRLDADFKLADNWFGGVELQTGYGNDTANQTFENGFSDYPIFISRAYLGYSPTDWLTLTAGKIPNPFYTTELVWDPDINPSGVTEQIAFHKLFGHPSAALAADGKSGPSDGKSGPVDGKGVAPAASPWELTLVAGQFIFDDNVEGGGRDPGTRDTDAKSDPWLFETQLIGAYRVTSNIKITFAPAWMVYSAGSVSVPASLTTTFGDFNAVNFQDSALVSGATRNLSILNAPGDISFKISGVPIKAYWDFTYNTEGRARANDTYLLQAAPVPPAVVGRNLHRTQDDFAWLVGLQVGENKKKGDLSFLANYRQTGISAVDPNLNDNEFALGFLNTKGFRFALNYNLTNAAILSVNYYSAWNLDRNLVGGEATGDNAIANANAAQTLQLDLNVKF